MHIIIPVIIAYLTIALSPFRFRNTGIIARPMLFVNRIDAFFQILSQNNNCNCFQNSFHNTFAKPFIKAPAQSPHFPTYKRGRVKTQNEFLPSPTTLVFSVENRRFATKKVEKTKSRQKRPKSHPKQRNPVRHFWGLLKNLMFLTAPFIIRFDFSE